MLNSCSIVNACFPHPPVYGYANLLNCHHNLNGVQAVKTEVVGEVRAGGELRKRLATFRQHCGKGFVLSKGQKPGETLSVCQLSFPFVPRMRTLSKFLRRSRMRQVTSSWLRPEPAA